LVDTLSTYIANATVRLNGGKGVIGYFSCD
jgi:hypothetical protein